MPTKKELDKIAEEQRRQRASVVDLAREEGMQGNRPGGVQSDEKPPKSEEK